MTLLLDFKHLTVMRGRKEALNDVSLEIPLGENVVLMGPNGSGKSTLLKLISRECYPAQTPGRVFRINGSEQWNVFELRHLLGIVSNDWQGKFERDISGMEAVVSGFFGGVGVWPADCVTAAMEKRACELLQFLGVAHLTDRSMREMSSGEARRILIARALVHDPKVLVLDEPSNSLDIRAVHEFQEALRRIAQSGKNILMATHHLHDIIPEIQRAILLQGGKIICDGKINDVLTAPTLSSLFNTSLRLSRQGEYWAWSGSPV